MHHLPHLVAALAGVVLVGAPAARAAEFTSGSTGALGDVSVQVSTVIALPPDGKLHYESLTVAPGVTVTFTPNARNTPVFVLATDDIVLGDGAVIEISGSDGDLDGIVGIGGPGGFDGGAHVDVGVDAASGEGPGGGISGVAASGGNGGYAFKGGGGLTQTAGAAYGNQLLLPLVGGSGGAGGGGRGGGGGGGAILLASSTRVAIGLGAVVRAQGGAGFGGYQHGSGGAVRVVAPVVAGQGTLDVSSAGGGHGRARVDALDTSALAFVVANGRYSVGSLMVAFLDVEPSLDILGVGQTSIPLGYDGEFLVVLPSGASATQDLTIRLGELYGTVPITIALTPESGTRVLYDVDVDMSDAVAGVKTIDVPVDFAANMPTIVRVWTRPPPAP